MPELNPRMVAMVTIPNIIKRKTKVYFRLALSLF